MRQNRYVFPNGFAGQFKIVKSTAVADIPLEDGVLVIRFASNGLAKVSSADYERLCAMSKNQYTYEDGTLIVPVESATEGSAYEGRPRVYDEGAGFKTWTKNGVRKSESWISGLVFRE